jgi:hypothetical protein
VHRGRFDCGIGDGTGNASRRVRIFVLKFGDTPEKKAILQHLPDSIAWLPESRTLGLCRLSRSTLNSWKKSGLELASERAAYGLSEVIGLALLVAAREYLPPKELVNAWRSFSDSPTGIAAVNAARDLEPGARFDLIVEPEHAGFQVARNETELLEAVSTPMAPRPVVVLDLSARIRQIVDTFHRIANSTKPPSERSPGRPRNAERDNVRTLRGRGGR